MERPAVSIISLGCAKNLVDTERVLGALVERGWLIAERALDADVVLVNTCGFIGEAREESSGVIEDALRLKNAGVVRAVVVIGCMVQLMSERLVRRFAEVDAWAGLAAPGAVADACDRAISATGSKNAPAPGPSRRPFDYGPRLRITPRHYAYLRISEGCDNRCRYCRIPAIRGALRSKPRERIIQEARELVADGARELIVIAQDTTSYGADLYGGRQLAALLRELRNVEGVRWLRLLYTHPAHIDDELIAVLAEGGVLLPYVDLPIQHANDAILERMGRHTSRDGLRDVIGRVRSAVPGAALRTSVIVGFPGEGEAEFNDLLDFIRQVRFDRLGAFAYSREPGTPAAALGGQVPDEVKQERLDAVMQLQREIAAAQSAALVGAEVETVVDGKDADGDWVGRTYRDAPDVDGAIRLQGPKLGPGVFTRAVVTEAHGYDLVGKAT